MKSSPLFSLNKSDLIKGLLMAALTPVVYTIQTSLEAGQLSFDWHNILIAALSGGLAYLLKNFLTPQTTETTKAEEIK